MYTTQRPVPLEKAPSYFVTSNTEYIAYLNSSGCVTKDIDEMGDLQATSFGGPALQEQQPKAIGLKPRNRTRGLSLSLSNLTNDLRHNQTKTELAIKITNTGSLSGLYAMIIASMAIVLTLSQVLSGVNPNSSSGMVLSAFHLYVYVAAFLFLVYLEVSIRKFKLWTSRSGVNIDPCVKSLSPSASAAPSVHNSEIFLINPHRSKDHGNISEADMTAGLDQNNMDYDSVHAQLAKFPAFQFNGEGVNLFARMGLITFGLAAVLLDGFRLLMMAEAPKAYKCYGLVSILPIAARMLFTFLQIFSLFKNHQVLINYRHVLMRFGLLHLAAANLCTWVYTLVLEAQQSFSSFGHSTKDNSTHHNGSYSSHSSSKDKDMVMISSCYRRMTLYDVASPYLYPFTIEFSLLAASMFYKLYSNIGHTTVCPAEDEQTKDIAETKHGQCQKANSGLFLGLALFVSAGLAMCLFIYLLSKGGLSDTTFMIYLISDIITNGLQLIAIIPSFYQFNKLRFTGILEEVFDQNLLIIALGGVYILLGFLGFAAATQVNNSGTTGTFAILQLTLSLLKFISATLQAIFIVDALRRRVKDPEHHHTKPGRSCVTFLLIANLAMWLINTFQLKEVHHAEMFTKVYGKLAWTIIMHIFLPVAVFFRFHASVSLSDIWQKTYDHHHVHTVHMLSLLPSMEEH